MSYVYKTLNEERRAQIIDQRVAQLEAEHFSHELNRAALDRLPESEDKQNAIASVNRAQENIVSAIDAVVSKRPVTPPAPPAPGGPA